MSIVLGWLFLVAPFTRLTNRDSSPDRMIFETHKSRGTFLKNETIQFC